MNESAKDRLVLVIKELGLSQGKFEKEARLSNGYVNKLKKSPSTDVIERIVGAFPNINPHWLLTGEGEMLRSAEAPYGAEMPEARMVPIIHIDSVGGLHSSNSILTPEYIEGYIPMTDARDGDVAIYQSGNSMSPAIPPGSLLLIREVPDWREYIGYGDVFVMLLRDDRRITKEVRRYAPDPQNYYWCVSYNPDVADEELPKKLVRGVWKVVKVLIDKGW